MLFVDTGDGHLHCQLERGAGRPVVFFNVLGLDLRIWEGVAGHMPGAAHLRFDTRGHGLSASGSDLSMPRHVDDAIGLIEHFGLPAPVLCGASAGGLVALGVAGARPDLVGGLVLCNTAARIGTAEMWADRIAAVARGGTAAIADGAMEKWFSPAFREGRPAELAGWKTMLTRCPADGYIGLCGAIRDTDFTGVAETLAVPAHVVGGARDGSTPPDVVERLAAQIPGATLTMFEEAGHLPCIEAPADLAELIAGFRDGLG